MDSPSAIDTAHEPDCHSSHNNVNIVNNVDSCIATVCEDIQRLTLALVTASSGEDCAERVKIQDAITERHGYLTALKNARTMSIEALSATAGTSSATNSAVAPPSTIPVITPSQPTNLPQNLPKFRTGAGSYQDPEDFVHYYEFALSAVNLDLDKNWARGIPGCVTPDTAAWFRQNFAPTLTWEEAKQKFLRLLDDPRRTENACLELHRLQMKSGESLSAYIQRFQRQMRLAKLPDSDFHAFCCLKATIPPDLCLLVHAELKRRGNPVVSISELIDIIHDFPWKPTHAQPQSTTDKKPNNSDKNSGPKKTGKFTCTHHGPGNHDTKDCYFLQGIENPGASARPSSQAKQPAQSPSNGSSFSSKKVTVETTGEAACATTDAVVDAKSASPILFDILLDGETHSAQLDTGATCSFISVKLAAALGLIIEPRPGTLKLAMGRVTMSRIGRTSPIRIQVGPMKIMYRCEVAHQLEDAQFLFGIDLIERIGLAYFASMPRFSTPSHFEGESAIRNVASDKIITDAPSQSDVMAVKKITMLESDRPFTEPSLEHRPGIILQHHLPGHFGTEATIAAIRGTGLDWPNITVEVKEACATCLLCQRHTIDKSGHHPLSPISADQPLDHVTIDHADTDAYKLHDNSGAVLPHSYPSSQHKVISRDDIFDSPSFELEAILNHRETDHEYEYLVRWKNHPQESDTWEPDSKFTDEDTIATYWHRRAAKQPFRRRRRNANQPLTSSVAS